MSESKTALPLRGDTLLGVCEAVGEDFGFPPNILRIAFAVMLLWNPTAVFCAYLALGAIVLLARQILPNPRRVVATRPATDGGSPPSAANSDGRLSAPATRGA
jgi:phage shock protein PspC (stress-responsive transcriptional regulator)